MREPDDHHLSALRAAAMCLGAQGVWTGSIWLTVNESEEPDALVNKLLAATSRDTLRSRCLTGKPARQLKTAWSDSWEAPENPSPLPMPLQSLVSEAPLAKITKLAEGGHAGAKQLATFFVGQGVGLMNDIQSTRDVVREFMEDYLAAVERMNATVDT